MLFVVLVEKVFTLLELLEEDVVVDYANVEEDVGQTALGG